MEAALIAPGKCTNFPSELRGNSASSTEGFLTKHLNQGLNGMEEISLPVLSPQVMLRERGGCPGRWDRDGARRGVLDPRVCEELSQQAGLLHSCEIWPYKSLKDLLFSGHCWIWSDSLDIGRK